MNQARKQGRSMVMMLMMVFVLVWLSGCSAGSSFSLSALVGDKQTDVNMSNEQKGPQAAGGGAENEPDEVIVGHTDDSDGQITHGNLPSKQAETPSKGGTVEQPAEQPAEQPSGTATDKPQTPETQAPEAQTPSPSATDEVKPSTVPATDQPEALPTEKPEVPIVDHSEGTEGTATDKPSPSATSKPDGSPLAEEQLDDPDPSSPVSKPAAGEKYIALTFDDGPDQRYTNDILDILKEKGVKATFFVVGQQVKKNPEVLQRIVEEGHSIGNHTYNHKDLSKLNKQQIIQEIKTTDAIIKKTVGYTPVMVRAPYGAVSDTLKVLLKASKRDLVSWNIDTRDWAGTSAADMSKMIKKEAKPNGIILMHSFGSKNIKNTVQALPGIIDDLVDMGYTLVTADQIV
ncbi:polysaccharide deacetylase family protein [Paenibacillus sinopodophylli]|uniref:polysaccharide deacetylase family protein n=1 Tax=Paenibacillus sinopodophylli TaxID=1837342 RepID=UPI001FE8D7D9|nr:polysaccharide deacetylase family protein [Paenibacillus sinopodophylli]